MKQAFAGREAPVFEYDPLKHPKFFAVVTFPEPVLEPDAAGKRFGFADQQSDQAIKLAKQVGLFAFRNELQVVSFRPKYTDAAALFENQLKRSIGDLHAEAALSDSLKQSGGESASQFMRDEWGIENFARILNAQSALLRPAKLAVFITPPVVFFDAFPEDKIPEDIRPFFGFEASAPHSQLYIFDSSTLSCVLPEVEPLPVQ